MNLRSIRQPVAPAAGEIAIDGYSVVELLGVGPLTAVYRAVLESHQQEVVLKVLLPHLAGSEVFVQRFLQSANAARLVTHDRVAPCYDVGQSNGWVYLACEVMVGSTLAELMEHGPVETGRAIYLAWQIATGIEAVHAAGLVHGNLRPSNVQVDDENGVRLADLGLPDVHEGDGPASPPQLHLPPEALAADKDPDAAGDIYAVGVVLIGALLGRTPWSGRTRAELASLHAAGSAVLDELPAPDGDLALVLARATARRREDRYAQAWQLREDLERLQYHFAPIHASADVGAAIALPSAREGGSRATRSVQALPPAEPPPKRWHAGWIALVLIAVVAAVGVAAFVAFSPARIAEPPAPATPAPAALPDPPAVAAPEAPRPSWASAAGSDASGRWADLAIGEARQRFRLIPAGGFWMGSPTDEPGRAADEERHLVTLTRAFWLGDSEVTEAFCLALAGRSIVGDAAADRPATSLSWNAVQELLATIGGRSGAAVRLPSEAEWEYACRSGGEQAAMPGADRAWTAASGGEGARPVRSLLPNAFGLYDMQGNVMEWVADTYGRYHREAATDPLATGGVFRVMRGGAWNVEASAARPAARGKALPVTAYAYLGFRLAITDG